MRRTQQGGIGTMSIMEPLSAALALFSRSAWGATLIHIVWARRAHFEMSCF